MAVGNTTPPTVDELLKYVEARLKITVDHYVYYNNLVANTAVVENEIRMLEALKRLVLEKKESR